MNLKEDKTNGFMDTFFSKLKEQSFTIILLVGMLYYQNMIFNQEIGRYKAVIDTKQLYIDDMIKEVKERMLKREEYLTQQRDIYVQDLINDNKK